MQIKSQWWHFAANSLFIILFLQHIINIMDIFLQSNIVSIFPLFNYEAIILLLPFPHDVINIFLRRLLGSNSSIQHQQQNNHLKCHYEFVFLCLNSLLFYFTLLKKHHRVLKTLIFVDITLKKIILIPVS